MADPESRPIPLLGDISLAYGQRIEHVLDAGFVGLPVVGLEGALQQRLGRGSHRIRLEGLLVGADALAELETLQQAAAAGEELTFSADITRALDLQQVVITHFYAVEVAGQPQRYAYVIDLVESPPLPPPAQVSAFGGLDDFGLGDLGFDTDILGDLQDLAGDIAGAVDQALDLVDQLGALANLANLDALSAGGLFEPLQAPVDRVRELGGTLGGAVSGLLDAFS